MAEVAIVDIDSAAEPLIEKSSQTRDGELRKMFALGKRIGWAAAMPVRFVHDHGIVGILISQAMYSLLGIFMKLLSKGGMPVFEPLFLRSALCLTLCWTIYRATGHKNILGSREIWKYCLLTSLAANVGIVLFLEATVLLPAGDAMAISKVSPVFAVICAWLCHSEKISGLTVAGGVASSLGGVIIAHPPLLLGTHEGLSTARIIGLTLALLSAILAAVCFTTIGRIGTQASSFTLGTWTFLGGIPIFGIPLLSRYPCPPSYKLLPEECMLLFSFVVLAFLGYLLLARGVQLCNGVVGTSMQPTAVFFSYLFGYFMLHESVTWFSLCGTVLIFLGVTMVSIGKSETD